MLVCCWFDLGLKLIKVENGTFENRTIAGNSHYLVPFGNRTIAGTALIETALTGDPLYNARNHKEDITEGASAQFPIWIFNFWPHWQLRVILRKNLGQL